MAVDRIDLAQVEALNAEGSSEVVASTTPARDPVHSDHPLFEIRGTKVFRSAWHPQGPSIQC